MTEPKIPWESYVYGLNYLEQYPDHIVNHVVAQNDHCRVEISSDYYPEYSGILALFLPPEYSFIDLAIEAQNHITLLPRGIYSDPT